ncbi:SRPBCC family protein [Jannaschia sp. KMU-145]|uniref:SRPBCC family protein n=1 Tax=Jannaschia halovivens TaxID=3388667 RepID=UPI00396B09B2
MTKVSTTRTINAPADAVWASLDDYGDIADWNDNLAASRIMPGSAPTGLGAKRQCDLKADGSQYLRETITEYVPGRRLGLKIDDTTMPMKGATCLFEVRPKGPHKTELVFTMDFKPPMGPIGVLMLPMMKPMLRGKMAKALEGNARHVERAAA